MANVLVPLARGCEELEAVTIIDLLRRAGIKVTVAGLEAGVVHCSRGVLIQPDCQLDEVLDQHFEMVVLPGGLPGADHLNDDLRIKEILYLTSRSGGYTAAICAAPKVLANHGLLENKTATSFPGILSALNLVNISISDSAVEVDGQVITSRGPGTAMDFALTLIEKLAGEEKRNEVEMGLKR